MRHKSPIPPILADLVYQAVSGVSGVQFTDATPCDACGILPVSHDLKRRRFSTIVTPEGPRHTYVYVKRFYCPSCGQLLYAPAPFYEKSRFGSPVVDLCISLSNSTSYSRAATIMHQLGIVIDRGTVRKTVLFHNHEVLSTDFFGLSLPQSIITLSALVTRSDDGHPLMGRDILEACGFNL